MIANQFNIRVYGLFINQNDEILLSDEIRFGMQMTKFPGGGLEPGEGPVDCLKREAIEEFQQEIEVISHFYTTDFYQQSVFQPEQQIISIYYKARFLTPERFRISNKPYDFDEKNEDFIAFRYQKFKEMKVEDLTLPIDQYVFQLLKKEMGG